MHEDKFKICIVVLCICLQLVLIQTAPTNQENELMDLSSEAHDIVKRQYSSCYYTYTYYYQSLHSYYYSYYYYYPEYYYSWCWSCFGSERYARYVQGWGYSVSYYYSLESATGYSYYSCYNGGMCNGYHVQDANCQCPPGFVGASCYDAYPLVQSMEAESLGTFIEPAPYKFTCSLSNVVSGTISMTIDGETYTAYDVSQFSHTLNLTHISPGSYQYSCEVSNSFGSDSDTDTYTIRESIAATFTQFEHLPDAGEACNTFKLTDCVDVIFLIDAAVLVNDSIKRIDELAQMLPNTTASCQNRFGLTLFGLKEGHKELQITSSSLFGDQLELESAIQNISNTLNLTELGHSDGYSAIQYATELYTFRRGNGKIVLFTNRAADIQIDDDITFENVIATLADNGITLSVFTNATSFYHYLKTPANRLIGMNFNKYIGFGDFSSCDASGVDLNVVPNPHPVPSDNSAYQSYVQLAWDTNGSAFDISYLGIPEEAYCPRMIAKLFAFAVLQDPSCQLADTRFNFVDRSISSSLSTWTDIIPQVESSCVDMIFLVDRSETMEKYITVLRDLVLLLPENEDECENRYGLVTYETSAEIHYDSDNNTFGTASQLYSKSLSINFTGSTRDSFNGINYIIENIEFRDAMEIRKHIVLFTNMERDTVDSTLTQSSILNTLRDNSITLSVVNDGDRFYAEDTNASMANTTMIRLSAVGASAGSNVGFRTAGDNHLKVDASSPVKVEVLSNYEHDFYVDVAWETGGIAFDLDYFASNLSEWKPLALFNKLVFSAGNYVPLQITSLTTDIISKNIQVECTTNNIPNVSISLILDGRRYAAENEHSLSVTIPLSTWNGTSPNCICLANNSISRVSKVEHLGIKIPQAAPGGIVLTALSPMTILAEWKDPHDHETEGIPLVFRITYRGYIFDTNEKNITTYLRQFILTNLMPYTTYSVFIQAITTLGHSNQSEIETETTKQDIPNMPPQELLATPNNSTSFLFSWNPPSPRDQNGNITHYLLTVLDTSANEFVYSLTIAVIHPIHPLLNGSEYFLTNLDQDVIYNLRVKAVNMAGESQGATMSVKIRDFDEMPIIEIPKENQTDNIVFSMAFEYELICESKGGHPPPNVYWTDYNHNRISGSRMIVTNEYFSSNPNRDKVFYCVAKNQAGMDVREVKYILIMSEKDILDDANSLYSHLREMETFPDNYIEMSLNAIGTLATICEEEATLERIAKTLEFVVKEVLREDRDHNDRIALALVTAAENIFEKSGQITNNYTSIDTLKNYPDRNSVVAIISRSEQIAIKSIQDLSKTFLNLPLSEEYILEARLVVSVAQAIPVNLSIQNFTFPGEVDTKNGFTCQVTLSNVDVLQLSVNGELRIVTTQIKRIPSKGISSVLTQISDIIIVETNTRANQTKNQTILNSEGKFEFSIEQSVYGKTVFAYLMNNTWQTDGLNTFTSYDNSTVVGTTSHFTSFAIFNTPYDEIQPISQIERDIVSIVTYAVIGISLFALIISLILFILAGRPFFRVEINIIYFNYCLSLLLSSVVFIAAIHNGAKDLIVCKVIAFGLHYLWMAVFTWTLCNGFLVMFTLLGVSRKKKIYPILIIFGWIFPLFIPLITIAITGDHYVDSSKNCFLNPHHGVVWSFIGPIVIMLLINMVFLSIAAMRLVTMKTKTEQADKIRMLRNALISALIYTPILGVPWVLLLVNMFMHYDVIEWVFILVNGTMGIVFFIVFVLRNNEVQGIFMKRRTEPTDKNPESSGDKVVSKSMEDFDLDMHRMEESNQKEIVRNTDVKGINKSLSFTNKLADQVIYADLSVNSPSKATCDYSAVTRVVPIKSKSKDSSEDFEIYQEINSEPNLYKNFFEPSPYENRNESEVNTKGLSETVLSNPIYGNEDLENETKC